MEIKQHTTEEYWATEEMKRENKRYIETNDNDSTTYQNFGDTAKAVIKGKFISL